MWAASPPTFKMRFFYDFQIDTKTLRDTAQPHVWTTAV